MKSQDSRGTSAVRASRWGRLLCGLFVVAPCVYGMLVALGLAGLGDSVALGGWRPAAVLFVLPLGAAFTLWMGGEWEERVLPALGRALKRLWPTYDAPPGPLTIGHVVCIAVLAVAVLGAVSLLLR